MDNYKNTRIIALYLPQFHPIPENDAWWGKGFTEWTNVCRAKPLFKGHVQPKIPRDLGYYDLRLPTVRQQQADLAHQAGVDGFCYWHYWFGDGKRLMQDIFDDVLISGKPDFPFSLGWANHSWSAKNWNTNDSNKDRLLIEQKYLGTEDYRKHYELVLKAFKDNRYVIINNKPLFLIYDAHQVPDELLNLLNKWSQQDGFDGIYFIGNISSNENINDYLKRGFSALCVNRITDYFTKRHNSKINFIKRKIGSHLFNIPETCADYSKASKYFIDKHEDKSEDIIPNIIPNFDHSPRSGKYGLIFRNSNPKDFANHVNEVLDVVKNKQNKLILLRSWNEWGEGNYMEPDLKFGKKYIYALRSALQRGSDK